MAREQPLAPPSSRARRPPKKVGERRRRVAMSQRDEREMGRGADGERERKWRAGIEREGFNGGGFCPAPRDSRGARRREELFRNGAPRKKETAGAAAALVLSLRDFVGDASLAGGPRTRQVLELGTAGFGTRF